jgi:hypothetical protein
MNFITTNHRGGLGNVIFKLAASMSLALDNNVGYIFSEEFIRAADPNYADYSDNILRNINFVRKLPSPYYTHREIGFHYSEIKYNPGSNLLLDGHFQSEKYFINNKEFIINSFSPSLDIKDLIFNNFPNVDSYCSIHIRRGDYLNFPNHHPQQSDEYFREATEIIGRNKTYLIFSDDMNGIKSMFDFLPNKIFYTSGKDWLDLYTMSLCNDNIICNSTFSWWAAYLNPNRSKKIIAPKKWFGSAYRNHNTSDLFPEGWITLNK